MQMKVLFNYITLNKRLLMHFCSTRKYYNNKDGWIAVQLNFDDAFITKKVYGSLRLPSFVFENQYY